MSWCRTGGRRYVQLLPALYWLPSTHCSGLGFFALFRPRQQNSDRRKPRLAFLLLVGGIFSSDMSFSVLGRVPADKRQPSGKVVSIESAADAKNVKALDSSPHPKEVMKRCGMQRDLHRRWTRNATVETQICEEFEKLTSNPRVELKVSWSRLGA
jgi:hypothetical protein